MLYQLSYTPISHYASNFYGGADGDRTRDPLHAMQVLVPAELQPHAVVFVLKTVLIIPVVFGVSTNRWQNLLTRNCDVLYILALNPINRLFERGQSSLKF